MPKTWIEPKPCIYCFFLYIHTVNLKNKTQVILPAKWFYLGITENCFLGQISCSKTIGKFNKRKRGMLFYDGGGSGEGYFE